MVNGVWGSCFAVRKIPDDFPMARRIECAIAFFMDDSSDDAAAGYRLAFFS